MGYALLKFLTGKKGIKRTINGFKVRFPVKWSRYFEHNYEADNYGFLRTQVKTGMQIIDIGAHIGLFSAIASQLTGSAGKIVCFEPTPETYEVLTQTLQLNHCRNVTPVQGAVSNEEGTAVFYVSKIVGCNSNSLVKNKEEKEIKANEVKLFTIDGTVRNFSMQPDLIKIDAEGAELDVLKGGLATFKKYKPTLILGLHPDFLSRKGDSLEEIWDLLEQSGYQVKEKNNTLTKSKFSKRTLLFDVHCV